MKKLYSLLTLFIYCSLSAQTYEYKFNNTLAEEGSGPTLVYVEDETNCGPIVDGSFSTQSISPCTGSKPAYNFNANGGLSFDNSASLIGGTYTIHMYFKFNSLSGYQRVIDFQDGGVDNGIYTNNGCLGFHPGTGVNIYVLCDNFSAGTFHLVTLVRNRTPNLVEMYVDGVLNADWLDDGTNNGGNILYVPTTATTPIIFFRDNTSPSGMCEGRDGSIRYLSLSPTASTSGQVSTFFSGICSTVLPLNLIDFFANKQNSQVSLNWTTENELNTSHFEIERSGDGQHFSTIGNVSANNNTSRHNYSFIDMQPLAGTNFYRLKMLDINGQFKYSAIVKVNLSGKPIFEVYPNPARDVITVNGVKAGDQVKLLNSEGKLVLQKISLGQSITIDVSKHPAGLYFVQSLNDAGLRSQKIMKQ